MSLTRALRRRWQHLTGQQETPLDGDTPAWILSLVFHLVVIVLLSEILKLQFAPPVEPPVVVVTVPLEAEEPQLAKEFFFSYEDQEEIGSDSELGETIADSLAPVEEESDISELEVPPQLIDLVSDDAPVVFSEPSETTEALEEHEHRTVKGRGTVGVSGAPGAIDRITQEILDSLNRQKTLVVWLFDSSVSLSAQRAQINERIDRIYEELGVIEEREHRAFAQHDDAPLLSVIASFGEDLDILTRDPTADVGKIKEAIGRIENDDTGVENVFTAVTRLAKRYRGYARRKDPRKVMLVMFTDEAGDDAAEMLDPAVLACQSAAAPVYVVGIPAPFGRDQVEVKWIDPDPDFDQTPQWAPVTQGPESLAPERIRIAFATGQRREEPLDSGFGPFALTRLSVATGGIYFAVHPNRHVGRPVSRRETVHLSAYLKYFFDPDVMRRYRPDYVSAAQYRRSLNKNKAKLSLVRAAQLSWLEPMVEPRLEFPKRSEAQFAELLTEAQKQAAKLTPKIDRLYQVLKEGEKARDQIDRPRWQAGYDLAMGRAMAAKVRTVGYNVMLAKAKRGMKFSRQENDTWILEASDEIHAGSSLEKAAERALMYLTRVKESHPGTPWALLAEQELRNPLGWVWTEHDKMKPPPPRRPRPPGNANPRPRPPRDDQPRSIPKPKPKRPVPKI